MFPLFGKCAIACFLSFFLSGCASLFPGTPELYPGQATILAQDSAVQYAREHIGPASVRISAKFYLDIRMYRDATKTGDPLVSVHQLLEEFTGGGMILSPDGDAISVHHLFNDENLQATMAAEKEKIRGRGLDFSAVDMRLVPEYSVTLSNGGTRKADVVKSGSEKEDLEAVKIKGLPGEVFPYVLLDETFIPADQNIAGFGNPFNRENLIFTGKVARRAYIFDNGEEFVMLYGPANSGNSGGGVVTLSNMKMVGIIAAVYAVNEAPSGIFYMIPVQIIRTFVQEVFELPSK